MNFSNEKDGVPNNERFWRQYNAPVRPANDTPVEERRQILAGTEAVFLLLKTPLQIKGVCKPSLFYSTFFLIILLKFLIISKKNAKKMLNFSEVYVNIAVQEGGQAGHSNSLPNGHSA